ncbi:hypothetical protein [Demequina iriomotensis]|uniref:hypothetical protein n=1 Tax=Demequina iriomotensis TaxID=1536641 RepID=UPI0007827462|nr:hypothetical protein [Demequina iriomotensis]
MSNADAAEGLSAGARRVATAGLPEDASSRPVPDGARASQFWGARTATPAAGVARAPIAPTVPDPVDPAVLLRRLADLAVSEAVGDVRVEQDRHTPKELPRRSEARGGGALSGGVPPAPPAPATPAAARPSQRADGGTAGRAAGAAAPSRRAIRARGVDRATVPGDEQDAALPSARLEALADLIPQLRGLSEDRRPEMRSLYALCYSLLAIDGQAPADRDVWRALLGLSKYDQDAAVRRAADLALTDLERFGTVPTVR